MTPGRVLALDIGTVRIGVAVSDPGRVIAQGVDAWPAAEWRQRFEACLDQYVARLVESLRAAYPDREFSTWDERFTTVIAERALLEADVSRARRRQRVDKVAAALILQSWLESQRGPAGRAIL